MIRCDRAGPENVHSLSGAAEVQLLGDGYEVTQLPQFHDPEVRPGDDARRRAARVGAPPARAAARG